MAGVARVSVMISLVHGWRYMPRAITEMPARRTRRQKGADYAPPPEEHRPDEQAECCVLAP